MMRGSFSLGRRLIDGKQLITGEEARAPSGKHLCLQSRPTDYSTIPQLSIKFVYAGAGPQTTWSKRQICVEPQSSREL